MSNTCAIVTAVAAGLVPNGWWIDPAGAIAISVYIVTRWLAIAKQQVSSMCCLYGVLRAEEGGATGLRACTQTKLTHDLLGACVQDTAFGLSQVTCCDPATD